MSILVFHCKRILELFRRFEYFLSTILGELLAPVTYGPASQHRYMHLGAKCLLRGVFFLPKLLRFCFLVCLRVSLISWNGRGHKIRFFMHSCFFGALFKFNVKNCRTIFHLCAAALGSTEENSKLSAALDQLSDVYQKVEKVHEEQARVRNIPS